MSSNGAGGAGSFPRPVTPVAPSTPPPADRRPVVVERPDPADLYAALDLGTNSCRMLIAQPKGNQLHVVDSFSKSVQLGQGLEASGRLGRASMARAIGALKICQKKLQKHRVERMRLVATEACRRATNAAEFISLVKRDTGLELEIIQPEEEARLAGTGLDRPRPRAASGPAEGDHAAPPGLRSPGHTLSPRQGCRLDLDPAGCGDAQGHVCRRGRRWRAVRADELVFRGATCQFLAL